MERGSPFHSEKFFNETNSPPYSGENFSEDMTQDSGPSEEDNKEHIQLLDLECGDTLELNNFEGQHGINKNDNTYHQDEKELESKSDVQLKSNEPVRSESDSVRCNSDFTISNSVNSMKSIRMNIRRKRFCSNSSAVSNNDEEKRPCRRPKKKRKRKTVSACFTVDCETIFSGYVKDDNVLTSSEQYVTHSGEVDFGLMNEQKIAMEMAAAAADSANLEVCFRLTHTLHFC